MKLRYKKAIKLSSITIVTSYWKFYLKIDFVTYYCKVLLHYMIWKLSHYSNFGALLWNYARIKLSLNLITI